MRGLAATWRAEADVSKHRDACPRQRQPAPRVAVRVRGLDRPAHRATRRPSSSTRSPGQTRSPGAARRPLTATRPSATIRSASRRDAKRRKHLFTRKPPLPSSSVSLSVSSSVRCGGCGDGLGPADRCGAVRPVEGVAARCDLSWARAVWVVKHDSFQEKI